MWLGTTHTRTVTQHISRMKLKKRRMNLLLDTIENSNMMQTLRVLNITRSKIRNAGGKRIAALVAADMCVK